MTALLLLGGGGHCRAVIDVIEMTAEVKKGPVWTVRGIVQPSEDGTESVLAYPILGSDEALGSLLADGVNALVTVGQIRTSALRRHLYALLLKHHAVLPVVVSPLAYVSRHSELGSGTVVMHGALVNAGAHVGVNCIINSAVLIEHDVEVGNHVHVATGARVNGGVRLGSGCFVGSGAIIHQGIQVGDDAVVAAGAVVRRDVPAGAIFKG